MVTLVSRTGRQLQRYRDGHRQVVGCIPYRYKNSGKQSSAAIDANLSEELEVLVISSRKGEAMLFPKGGWESDESMKEAATRETLEEAGVKGNVEDILGKWSFQSRSNGSTNEGYMFPLRVEEELEFWPEKNVRQRQWLSLAVAKEVCPHSWMKEALEALVQRIRRVERHQQNKEEDETVWMPNFMDCSCLVF